MKKLILITTLLLSFHSNAKDGDSPEDRLYEQAWQTVSKSRYTRLVREKQSTRFPAASTDKSDRQWFENSQIELNKNKEFDFEASFQEIDKLI